MLGPRGAGRQRPKRDACPASCSPRRAINNSAFISLFYYDLINLLKDLSNLLFHSVAVSCTIPAYLQDIADSPSTYWASLSTCALILGLMDLRVTKSTGRSSKSSRKNFRSMYALKVAGPLNSTKMSISLSGRASSLATDPKMASDLIPKVANSFLCAVSV